MAQINALLIFVPGLFKYHQTQSPKGTSLNSGCSAFQSKCLDYHNLFICLLKNVLKAQSPKSKKLLQRGDIYAALHGALWQGKKMEIQRKHRKTFQSFKLFQPGTHDMGKQQSFHGTFLVSSWIFLCHNS